MKPCISEATIMPRTFAEDVAHFADAGCPGMEVWLTKLEHHLDQHSAADTRKLLADRGIDLAAAAYQGGLLLSQGEQREGPLRSLPPPARPLPAIRHPDAARRRRLRSGRSTRRPWSARWSR